MVMHVLICTMGEKGIAIDRVVNYRVLEVFDWRCFIRLDKIIAIDVIERSDGCNGFKEEKNIMEILPIN